MANIKDYIPDSNPQPNYDEFVRAENARAQSEENPSLCPMYINRHNSQISRKTSFGVDTIHFQTREYIIKDKNRLTPKYPDVPISQFEERTWSSDEYGNPIFENRLYSNSGLFNIDINYKGLLIKGNASKLFHSYQLQSDEKQFAQFLTLVDNELKELGIIAESAKDMRMSRLDISKQFQTNYDTILYPPPIMKYVRANRVKDSEQPIYPNAFRFGNGSWESTCYDKPKEQENSGVPKELRAPENTMRGENKAFGKQNVYRYFGVETGANIIDAGFDFLRGKYNEMISDKFKFPSRSQMQNEPTLSDEIMIAIESLKYAQKRSHGNFQSRFFEKWSLETNPNIPSLDVINRAVEIAGCDKNVKYRLRNMIPELLSQKQRFEKMSAYDLITEIQEKLTA